MKIYNNIDEAYFDMVNHVRTYGRRKENRTGVSTTSVSGYMLQYDMASGFPLLTTKKMAWKSIRVELEGFIKGITNKRWFQERGCKIWNEWCTPAKVAYGHDEETQAAMAAEPDLGPIYGFQWRNFNGRHNNMEQPTAYEPSIHSGVDQLAWAVDQLKTNPNSRRIIVSAWNPQQLDEMALVPCHYSFQLLCNDGVLDLIWNQRSCDLFLGVPFNIASYGLLLELIAKECGLTPGLLIGSLGDLHIYENHQTQLSVQRNRIPLTPPTLKIDQKFTSLFSWEWNQATLSDYECYPPIKGEVAI